MGRFAPGTCLLVDRARVFARPGSPYCSCRPLRRRFRLKIQEIDVSSSSAYMRTCMHFRDLLAKPPSRSSSLDKSRTPTPESSDDDTAPSSVLSAWTFEKFVAGLDDADPFIAALVDVLVKVRGELGYTF